MVIEYYSSTLMYLHLCSDKGVERWSVEGMMLMSVKEQQTYAQHIRDAVKYRNIKSFLTWMVPADFNPYRDIYDPRYL